MNTLIYKSDPITEQFNSGDRIVISEGSRFVKCIESGLYVTKGFKYMVVEKSGCFITIIGDTGKKVTFISGCSNFEKND